MNKMKLNSTPYLFYIITTLPTVKKKKIQIVAINLREKKKY